MSTAITSAWQQLTSNACKSSPASQLPQLRMVMELALKEYYRANLLEWPKTLSSAITDFCSRNQLGQNVLKALHRLRRNANFVMHEGYPGSISDLQNGLYAIRQTVYYSHGIQLSQEPDLQQARSLSSELSGELSAAGHKQQLEAQQQPEFTPAGSSLRDDYRWGEIVEIDTKNSLLSVRIDNADESGNAQILKVSITEHFAHLLDARLLYGKVNLIGERLDEQSGISYVEFIVLEPDYLVNVTQIAECFLKGATLPCLSFINALRSDSPNAGMFFGNLVNHLLDQEIAAAAQGRDFRLDDFIQKELFRFDPLGWSGIEDFQSNQKLVEEIGKLKQHYHSIRHARQLGFINQAANYEKRQSIDIGKASLEPAFISAKYGLQGRLDLLHMSEAGYDLVELKSSKNFPNYAGQVWKNHQAQALLYRLLLEQVAADNNVHSGQTSILYSAAQPKQSPLRHVQSNSALMVELVATRNMIVMLEQQLADAADSDALQQQLERIFAEVQSAELPPYLREQVVQQQQLWLHAESTAKNWALEFLRFSAKELQISMQGHEDGMHNRHGMSAIWRSSIEAKKQAGSMLDDLSLQGLELLSQSRLQLAYSQEQQPQDHAAVNFREGDTLLLYPRHRKNSASDRRLGALQSQGLKVTLEKIDAEGVLLNLMGKLVSRDFFENHDLWALEPANYDTYRKDWAHISNILALAPEKRQLLLGQRLPARPTALEQGGSDLQQDVVAQALAAPDYYLLCGPPGTGKTSTALKRMVQQLYQNNQTILLAAYTRRAVDEICQTLENIAAEQAGNAGDMQQPFNYIRLTSELHTEESYHPRLLDTQLKHMSTRQQVREHIENCRIFVGTVSGLLQKQSIFQFKNFDVAIIDEASQILEIPSLALVSKVAKFILIGDHKQLPAVVQQSHEQSLVSQQASSQLQAIGLENLRGSYFERMFRLCKKHAPWACGTLQVQYRMHDDIMALVNRRFYANQLRSGSERQQTRLMPHNHWHHSERPLHKILRQARVIFHPTGSNPDELAAGNKQNAEEAKLAAEYALEIALGLGEKFDPSTSLGIIASYRNQVALIRNILQQLADEQQLPALARISVDTVERYQGSQRDYIILSFSVNYWWQMQQIVNTSIDEDNGSQIDRKLNVALTRAREQLILLGNPEVLQHAETHANLLADITANGGMIKGLEG